MSEIRHATDSSAIAALTYDDETEELRVEFTDGHVYVYESFPIEVLSAWIGASSIGGFFNANVRGKYG